MKHNKEKHNTLKFACTLCESIKNIKTVDTLRLQEKQTKGRKRELHSAVIYFLKEHMP